MRMIDIEILSALSSGRQMYGLQLVKESALLKRGTVYVHLARLERGGLVRSVEEERETVPGLPRRLYSITEKGQQALRSATDAEVSRMQQGLAQ